MSAPAGRRAAILLSHHAVLATYADVIRSTPPDPDAAALGEQLFWTGERLRHEYLELLPEIRLSRCPHSGAELVVLMDTYDLDGLWWRYHGPLRITGERPPTLIALTGAVALGGTPPRAPFLVKPGPGAPYVIPRLLRFPGVIAVLSQVAVGSHTGYAISYFAASPDGELARANEWGSNGFTRVGADGRLEWGAVPEDPSELDFDLGPWLEQGKLRWIAPGDRDLRLQIGQAGCPYLGLAGRRDYVRIEDGRVW